MAKSEVKVGLEFTPDPDKLKYSVNRQLSRFGTQSIASLKEAETRSPFAFRLLSVPKVTAVSILRDGVIITKAEDGDLESIHQQCVSVIKDHLASESDIFTEKEMTEQENKAAAGSSTQDQQVEQRVREILDNEIRPRVAMDGGDVEFVKYENGTVYVRLQGACRGCPGAKMTLKMGVERRLCEEISEVKEVVAV